jgi:hypothetical protein
MCAEERRLGCFKNIRSAGASSTILDVEGERMRNPEILPFQVGMVHVLDVP